MGTATSALPFPDIERRASRLFRLSIGVFFIGGFLTSSVSLLVPQLKLMLHLDYREALLVQLAFHASYMLFAVPITWAIVRSGYMRAIILGLAIMTLGCMALTWAQEAMSFSLVLGALLLLSGGQTFLQIASNTVVAVIGPSQGAARRLTLLQGFNSLGTVMGPLISAPLLLGEVDASAHGSLPPTLPFTGTALITAFLGVAYLVNRNLLADGETRRSAASWHMLAVLRSSRLRWGTAAIFVYVGAEVAIGALLPDVLMRPDRLNATPVMAGQMVSLYWGGAMVGRFMGAWIMARMREAKLLLTVASGAILLILAAILLPGSMGAGALIAVGLCNAIMYPTIYVLALPSDEQEAPAASMWLCIAVVGGAIIPVTTGALADMITLLPALLLPAACYALIARFAMLCHEPRKPLS
jgi:FHS family L-fucose permease-like MFS transporter